MAVSVIILAAGEGSRMHSDTPKVLHSLAGKPLLSHVVAAAQALDQSEICVVYGHAGEQVRAALTSDTISWVEQKEQLGTGHAVAAALPTIPDDHQVLILYGDVPLLQTTTLISLLANAMENLALLTVDCQNPAGYGRIIRNDAGQVCAIVEDKDASLEQRNIIEINTGIMAAPAALLRRWVNALDNQNAQGEYYLTDIVAMSVAEGRMVNATKATNLSEVQGVNNRLQLSQLERDYQQQQAQSLLLHGVMISDPKRFDLRGTLTAGRDVLIDINVVLEGDVILGDRVNIAAGVVIRNSTIGDDVNILPYSVIDDSQIGDQVNIGPFARIRPDTKLADGVKIGNFVEIKKADVDTGSKINHLSYVGDAIIGKQVNIGAGTITCNYDGANKHQTIIGDNAFIGSDSQLVAPVSVGKGATIGAGTTLTSAAPDDQLTISRTPQKSLAGWSRPKKMDKK